MEIGAVSTGLVFAYLLSRALDAPYEGCLVPGCLLGYAYMLVLFWAA